MRRLTTHSSAKSRLCRFVMCVYLEAYLRVFWAAYKEMIRNG